MVNLGQTEKEHYGECCPEPVGKGKKKERIFYPNFSIRDRELPISGDQVGKDVDAVVKLKVTRVSKDDQETGKKFSYAFDIKTIDFGKGKVAPADMEKMIEDELKKQSNSKKE